MSNIGTAIQQSVGILSQLVAQGRSNHAHMITPQPYQMHQTAYQEARACTQEVVLSPLESRLQSPNVYC